MDRNMETETQRSKASQRKRKLIVEAAIKCFIEKGFHQTSIRDIASAANISLGNLYNHFASKSALILELAKLESLELETFIILLGRDGNPAKLLAKFVDQFLDYCLDPINLALSVEFIAEASRNDEVGQAFCKNRIALIMALKELIERGIVQGDFASDANSKLAPEFILDLIEGLAMRSTPTGKNSGKQVRRELHRIIEKYLGA